VEAASVPDPGQAAGTGISTNVGGREPTGSSLVMTGGEVLIGGEYEKGQILEARVTLEVGEWRFRDKKDRRPASSWTAPASTRPQRRQLPRRARARHRRVLRRRRRRQAPAQRKPRRETVGADRAVTRKRYRALLKRAHKR
jgi:hypothetical protein